VSLNYLSRCVRFRLAAITRASPAFDPKGTFAPAVSSGDPSALAGKVLKDMGYTQVYNMGAFKDWAESGGAVEKPIDNRA
jgi:hypothetical protein